MQNTKTKWTRTRQNALNVRCLCRVSSEHTYFHSYMTRWPVSMWMRMFQPQRVTLSIFVEWLRRVALATHCYRSIDTLSMPHSFNYVGYIAVECVPHDTTQQKSWALPISCSKQLQLHCPHHRTRTFVYMSCCRVSLRAITECGLALDLLRK